MDGFFESSANLTNTMDPDGLTVACGRTGDGGSPSYGKSYLVTANAFMVNGASASDSMTVFCPAFDGNVYVPSLQK
jgi:hypothetical protein